MPLPANPTRPQVLNAYDENSDYDLVGSVVKCREFIRACRLLMSPRFLMKRASHGLSRGGGEEVEIDQKFIAEVLAQAEAWLTANDTSSLAPNPGGGGVVHPDFASFRD